MEFWKRPRRLKEGGTLPKLPIIFIITGGTLLGTARYKETQTPNISQIRDAGSNTNHAKDISLS